jgi:DNA modification methylase
MCGCGHSREPVFDEMSKHFFATPEAGSSPASDLRPRMRGASSKAKGAREWPADSVERWPIERLIPYAKNARTHSDAQVAQIAASMKEWGWTNPVLADEAGGLISGHGRILAARQLGITEVPVMIARGWTEAQKRAYVIADNKLVINGGWNDELLRLELGELQLGGFDLRLTGFGDLELKDILAERTEGLTDPDDAPPVPEHPVTRVGDLWLLGRHRLLCGDSTIGTDVERVLGGVKPHLMVTDPPYGVMLNPSWRDKTGANTKGKSGKGGADYMDGGAADRDARWDDVWALFPGDVCYVWCASARVVEVWQALSESGLLPHQLVVWDKGVLTLTRTHYWYTHEICIYAWRKSGTAHWVGKSGQASVWQIPSPKHIMGGSKEKNEAHPGQKPVECMRRPIENNSSPGQAVYEPFTGSGTTIVAAEQTGRSCIGLEISPPYVDVSVRRWQNFTGELATLDGDGRTFDEIAAMREPVGAMPAAAAADSPSPP